MGRKSREKKNRKADKETEAGLSRLLSPEAKEEIEQVTGSGDLRLVPTHIQEFLAGNEQAEMALRMLGRDASFPVKRAAEETGDERLVELAQSLAAMKPAVDTNLWALREVSVAQRISDEKDEAPDLSGVSIEVESPGVVIFDPQVVAHPLARGGKTRTDPTAIGEGKVACFVFPDLGTHRIELLAEPPPEGQATLELRLRVESGLVYVGPAEASDGPRLGLVRLDPFRTNLDEHAERGAFLRLEEGLHRVDIVRTDEGARVYVQPGEGAVEVDLGSLLPPEIAS